MSRAKSKHLSSAVVLAACLIAPVVLLAATPRPSLDPSTSEYVTTYKVTAAEAKRRQELTKEAGKLDRRLQLEQPTTFAGLYVEHQPKFRVVVRFTTDAEATLRRYTKSPAYVAETAPRSLEFLMAAQEEIGAQLQAANVPFETGLDIAASEVHVGVPDPTLLAQQANVARLFGGSFIKVHKATGRIRTTSVNGGVKLTGSSQRCTTGFNVFDSVSNKVSVITAGHCDNQMTYDNTSMLLDFEREDDQGSFDVQVNRQPSGRTPKPQANQIEIAGAIVEITQAIPSTELPVGAHVCKSGFRTGHTCGEVADKNSQSNYNNALGTYIRVRSPLGTVMTDHGDSGGPVFEANAAYGIVHGRGEDDTPYENDMFFMPIDRLSEIHLEVVTSPFEIDSIVTTNVFPGSFLAQAAYKGRPHFPVTTNVVVLECPSGMTCIVEQPSFATYTPSFVFGVYCINGTTPRTVKVQYSATDASGVVTPPVEHQQLCASIM